MFESENQIQHVISLCIHQVERVTELTFNNSPHWIISPNLVMGCFHRFPEALHVC